MTNSSGSVGTTEGLDTHQMKNMEWGAVAYLTHSIYGKNSEVWLNPYGDGTTWRMKTGYAGGSVNSGALAEGNANLVVYNTGNGPNASTTGNVYGIYDMSGGAWEYVAAFLDNGNSILGTYGTSTFFTNNKLKVEYEKYYDVYEPGDEEKIGGQYYGTGMDALWNANNSLANNTIRKRLTDATYAKMINRKGDALYETSSQVSYYGKNSAGNNAWMKNESDTSSNYETGWNTDYQLCGHGNLTWFMRGSGFSAGSNAGLFSVSGVGGPTHMDRGFRPVLVEGEAL
jgi:hypothetical protein